MQNTPPPNPTYDNMIIIKPLLTGLYSGLFDRYLLGNTNLNTKNNKLERKYYKMIYISYGINIICLTGLLYCIKNK